MVLNLARAGGRSASRCGLDHERSSADHEHLLGGSAGNPALSSLEALELSRPSSANDRRVIRLTDRVMQELTDRLRVWWSRSRIPSPTPAEVVERSDGPMVFIERCPSRDLGVQAVR